MCGTAPVTPPAEAIPPEKMEMLWEALEYVKEYEVLQNRTEPDDAINNALMEFENGSDGTTKQEVMLQLPSNED